MDGAQPMHKVTHKCLGLLVFIGCNQHTRLRVALLQERQLTCLHARIHMVIYAARIMGKEGRSRNGSGWKKDYVEYLLNWAECYI